MIAMAKLDPAPDAARVRQAAHGLGEEPPAVARAGTAWGGPDGLILDAYLLLLRCVVPRALGMLSLPRLFELLLPHQASTTTIRAVRALAHSERIAPRLRCADTCLFRSIVRWVALRHAGVNARFVMGIQADAPEIGHAWVEVNGLPVGESSATATARKLVPTFAYPKEPPCP
jgi:hypothetical protein